MGQEWVTEARKLVLSDSLFPALRETKNVLEELLTGDVTKRVSINESSEKSSNLQVEVSSNLQHLLKINISFRL